MSASETALLARGPDETIAIRRGQPVKVREFLAEVSGLAARLPASGYVINACDNRYSFLTGFAAALSRGLTTLLPPSPVPEAINGVARAYPGSFVLSDREGPRLAAPVLRPVAPVGGPATNPAIPSALLAAVAFTSGTTGSSVPHEKTWETLVRGADINAPHYLGRGSGPVTVVATVPPQHMYGLEATVLLPMRRPAIAHDGRPFYPANVLAALEEAPEPRMLVSTPVHLRALAQCGLRFPRLARVLSATAPLEADLAATVEGLLGGELIEIYGCTEVGSLAWRRAASDGTWRFFDQFSVEPTDDGTWVSGDHLPAPVRLPDILDFQPDGGFRLTGRDTDLVKVAGKRASLAELTRALLAVPGVTDAVVLAVPRDSAEARVGALAVSATLDVAAIRAALRKSLDPVLIPRPILMVPELPRSPTGKLAREAVLKLFREKSSQPGSGG